MVQIAKHWYVIHTQTGHEERVKTTLENRVQQYSLQEKISQVLIPTEKVSEIKAGKKKISTRKFFPGYVLVDMTVDDESWYVVRNTPNVTGFVGSGIIPVPVSAEEFKVVRRHMGETDPKFKIDFQMNDPVMVLDGPFANYDGLIQTIDKEKGKVKVLITIFGRETPVELDFTQIKKK